MKRRLLNLLACAIALPLIAGCGPKEEVPEAPKTYKVIVDKYFGHIEVTGKTEGFDKGASVSLTIKAIDDFSLIEDGFRVYENTKAETNVKFTWAAETSKMTFKMPANDVILTGKVKDKDYDYVLDKYTPLDGGDVETNGVKLHFDENLVTENCETGFIELAPFGSLYLESYLPGIAKVFVKEIYDGEPDGGFSLGKASTPNAIDGDILYTQTTASVELSPEYPYFVINNREKKNVIEYIKFNYTPNDTEKDLKELIKVNDISTTFVPEMHLKPYEVYPIDETKIPDNRIVKPIEPLEYTEPGEYIYGYEVYSKTNEGQPLKLLYTSKAKVTLKGSPSLTNWAVFHLKDKTAFIQVANNKKVDISLNEDVKKYNWNNKFNDFDTPFTSDRHFYPTYSVVGLPDHKNADGCYPLSISYNGFDNHIEMPDPLMKPGYTFGGWFMDFECTKPFDPQGSYAGDYTLYAKCLEEVKNYRKVFYYDYDGTILDRIDYLEEKDGAELILPSFDDVGTSLTNDFSYQIRVYELRMGPNRIDMLRPQGQYPNVEEVYEGDTLKYDDIKDYDGDIKLIVSRAQIYQNPFGFYSLFFEDVEGNTVISGFTMDSVYQSGDRILAGRYYDWDEDYHFDYTTYHDAHRCDEFTLTDEVDGYIIDQGSYTSIASYGYGNKYEEHAKPLEGILRHDSVLKVNRRAFFNRYGLKGTYFPRFAREFGIESYANTYFNSRLLLPNTLDKIGQRAFVGSENIKVVCLPRSITSIGKGAFSLADYNEAKFAFENVRYRDEDEKILFYYEGSEKDFKKLDDVSKDEILNNASNIVYNTKYTPYFGR